MPIFAASWESLLVFLVIVLLSAVSNWLKQRQARRERAESQTRAPTEQGEPSAPPPLTAPREPEATDWERELRRLFGEEPETPSLPPPRTPSVPLPSPLPAPPSPARQPELVPQQTTRPPRIGPEPEIKPIALPPGTHFAPTAEALDSNQAPAFGLAPLAESAAALHRASLLQEEALTRLHRASALTAHPTASLTQPRERSTPPEIARVRTQLRQPRTAREVILATALLGPPRALEPQR